MFVNISRYTSVLNTYKYLYVCKQMMQQMGGDFHLLHYDILKCFLQYENHILTINQNDIWVYTKTYLYLFMFIPAPFHTGNKNT